MMLMFRLQMIAGGAECRASVDRAGRSSELAGLSADRVVCCRHISEVKTCLASPRHSLHWSLQAVSTVRRQ
jgi:hypothetical protein